MSNNNLIGKNRKIVIDDLCYCLFILFIYLLFAKSHLSSVILHFAIMIYLPSIIHLPIFNIIHITLYTVSCPLFILARPLPNSLAMHAALGISDENNLYNGATNLPSLNTWFVNRLRIWLKIDFFSVGVSAGGTRKINIVDMRLQY